MLKIDKVVIVNFKNIYLYYSIMSSKNASHEEDYLRKLVAFAVEDENFRNDLILSPKEAIGSKSNQLGFSYDQLSDESREVISSFTAEELDTLRRIFLRAKKIGIDLNHREMF